MKKIVLLTALLASSAIATAESVPYVSGSIGVSQMSVGTNGMYYDPTFLGGVGTLAVGNLWGNANSGFKYGVEAALNYYSAKNDFDFLGFDNDATYTGYNLSLLGVAKYEFNSGFVVLGKAGGAYVHQKLDDTVAYNNGTPVDLGSDNGNKIAPEVALGVGYKFSPRWETDLTADTVFAGVPYGHHSSNPVTQVNTISLGMTYHFA